MGLAAQSAHLSLHSGPRGTTRALGEPSSLLKPKGLQDAIAS